ncbi:MAG: hypothetical protein GY928_30550 [Colwellia sp.]|nr:hypothetical protein [Colwellia sp.]
MEMDQIAMWVGYIAIFISSFLTLSWIALEGMSYAVRNYMVVPKLITTMFVISQIRSEVRKEIPPEEIKNKLWRTWVNCVDDIIKNTK